MKVYPNLVAFCLDSKIYWILEPESEEEKKMLEKITKQKPEGKYNIRVRPSKEQKTYTLELEARLYPIL